MKYFIKTFGCQMNESDSERIAGFLEMHKIKPAKDTKDADLIIFNTCGVRQSAENRVYGLIHNLRESGSKSTIVLTGCLADRKDVRRRLESKVDLFCEIKDFPEKFVGADLVSARIKGQTRGLSLQKNYLCLSPKYTNPRAAFVPIMTGCNNFCSYCVVPYARGREVSRPTEDIIKEIKLLVKNGCEEITLLGQNVNSYKFPSYAPTELSSEKSELSSRINFPFLLNSLAKSYSHIHFKFLTSHPKDFSDELIGVIAKNGNISREIHLPFQAGSDKILKAMNRPYTQKKYLSLIKKIRKAIPEAGFTTDVIVGFPGETKKDFLESVKIFKIVGYNEAYINKYSPRPGTAAWKMKDNVPLEEKKRREKILRGLVDSKGSKSLSPKRLLEPKAQEKILVILGPTSSGKSDVAIRFAKKFDGEIISADSRQVYRRLDIGTGKITKAEQKLAKHYLIDNVSPKTNYNAARFKRDAEKIIGDILKRGKVPIICGGTGFWIKALVDDVNYPKVKPDWKLRNELRNKSAEQLFAMLQKLDPERAKNIDAKNPVRLIRAIEICKTLGKVPSLSSSPSGRGCLVCETGEGSSLKSQDYNFLQIGIQLPKEKLHKNIQKRLEKRFDQGMVKEVKNLHSKEKLSWKKIESFGLGYFWIPKYLKGEIKSKDELFEKILQAEKDYAKRQMTWFGKDQHIKWLDNYKTIKREVDIFLQK